MPRLAATKLNVNECAAIVAALLGPPTDAEDSSGGRFSAFHTATRLRDAHFYNTKAADQHLPPPHDKADTYQSDVIRQSWVALKSRLTENPFVIRIDDTDLTPTERRYANDVEAVLQQGLELVEQRERFSILADGADGQILHGLCALHWRKAMEVWPAFPEYDFADAPAEDYSPEPDDADEAEDGKHVRRKGRYRETDASRLRRDTRAKSRTFPWHIEVVRGDQMAFVADRAALNGLAIFVVSRRTPLLDYNRKLKSDGIVLSLDQAGGIRVAEEQAGPGPGDPSYVPGGDEIIVTHLWTRDECYELAAHGQSPLVLVKSFPHCYGMPPFELVTADEVHHPDPLRAFLPAVEGLYRIKPFYDHDMTLGRIIAEQIALPFYWVRQKDGSFMLDDQGKQLVFTRNALAAQALPEGAELVKIEFDMNPAFMTFLQQTGKELIDAAPQTGDVEIGASTQPYTLKLAQEQANPPVKKLKATLALAIRGMVRNMLTVHALPEEQGGFGRPVPVSVREDKKRRIAEIVPGPKTLDLVPLLEVDINPLSAAQNVTNMEFSRTLLNDPKAPYTRRRFAEEAMNAADPDRVVQEADAEELYYAQVYPVVATQNLAKHFGKLFAITPDGQFVNAAGQQTPPETVLAANGVTFPAGGGGVGPLAPIMPPAAPLRVPGAMAEPALR